MVRPLAGWMAAAGAAAARRRRPDRAGAAALAAAGRGGATTSRPSWRGRWRGGPGGRFVPDLLIRRRATAPQDGGREARAANQAGAFALTPRHCGGGGRAAGAAGRRRADLGRDALGLRRRAARRRRGRGRRAGAGPRCLRGFARPIVGGQHEAGHHLHHAVLRLLPGGEAAARQARASPSRRSTSPPTRSGGPRWCSAPPGGARCRRSSSARRTSAASTDIAALDRAGGSTGCWPGLTAVRAALVQLCSGDDPAANLPVTEALVREAAAGGAALVLTPECTNLVSRQPRPAAGGAGDRGRGRDAGAAARGGGRARDLAAARVALPEDRRRRRALRQPLVPDRAGRRGAAPATTRSTCSTSISTAARATASRPPTGRARRRCWPRRRGCGSGSRSATTCASRTSTATSAGPGREVLAVPSAFTVPTGRAHWHVLLRARAIETGAYVLAPAQSGVHAASRGAGAATFGHSLAVGPWGEVLLDLGEGTRASALSRSTRPRSRGRARGCRRSGTTGGTPDGRGASARCNTHAIPVQVIHRMKGINLD